jgi:hypothetical protein
MSGDTPNPNAEWLSRAYPDIVVRTPARVSRISVRPNKSSSSKPIELMIAEGPPNRPEDRPYVVAMTVSLARELIAHLQDLVSVYGNAGRRLGPDSLQRAWESESIEVQPGEIKPLAACDVAQILTAIRLLKAKAAAAEEGAPSAEGEES